MHIHSKFRRRLLGSSALVAGAFFMATSAQATPASTCAGGNVVTDGVTITCSGGGNASIYGDGSNATITLSASTVALGDTYVGGSGNRVLNTSGDHNTVTFGASSHGYTSNDNKAANFDGNNNTMTLNGASSLNLDFGNVGHGTTLDMDGDDNVLTLNAGSSINVSGAVHGNYASVFAVNINGEGNQVVLNGGSTVSLNVSAEAKYAANENAVNTALLMDGEGSTLTLNNSSILVDANNDDKYARTFGAQVYGEGSKVTLNGTSVINVENYNGDKYSNTSGLVLSGDNAALVLNDSSAVTVDAYNNGRNSNAYGVQVYGDGATVTLNGTSHVDLTVHGDEVGGDGRGLTLRGDEARLTMNGASAINVSVGSDEGSHNYLGALVAGIAPVVQLNAASSINLTANGDGSNNTYTGLSVSSFGEDPASAGQITLNGSSSVNVTLNGDGDESRPYAIGVLLGGNGPAPFVPSPRYAPSLTLNGSSGINVLGTNEDSSALGYYIGVKVAEDQGVITLNGTSHIKVDTTGEADVGKGIFINSNDTTVVLNNASSIQIGREDGNDEVQNGTGIDARGEGASITLNDTAAIRMYADTSTGVRLSSYYGSLTLNDQSSVRIAGDGVGVDVNGTFESTVTLNDASFIQTNSGNGINLTEGANNAVTLNDTASVITLEGNGVSFDEQKYSSLTLNDHASIIATNGAGVLINASNGTTVTLNGSSSIVTDGIGILVAGQRSYFDGHSVIYYGSRNTTINVNAGTSVVGDEGIEVRDGAENTTINVSGRVEGIDGTAVNFTNALNSTLVLNTGAELIGSVVGNGTSRDSLILNGAGTLDNEITDFDYLAVTGEKGDIWKLASNLDLDGGNVDIQSGQLSVNGTLSAGDIYVDDSGTLGGSGTINGNVIVLAGGTVSPGNSPGTLNVVGNVNFTPGSGFKVQVEGNKADLLNVTGGGVVTIDPGTSITMEFLGGVDGFVGDVISSGAPVVGTFTTFIGGVFDYSTPGFVSLTSASPSAPNAGMTGASNVGFTFLDAVIDNAENGIGKNKAIWGTGLYNQTNRSAMGTVKGVDVQSSGLAMGGDVFRADNFGIGLAAGYIDGTATAEGGGSDTDIKGYNVAAYTTYGMGNTFFTAAATAAYQDQDVSRRVLSMGSVTTANSAPEAWTAGAGASVGHTIPVQGAWTITPRASFGWQHVARDGYSETGGGLAAMSLDKLESDTMRGQVGAELAFTVKDPNALWSVRPSVRAALAKEIRTGDSMVNGNFLASGAAFSGKTDDRDQTYAAIGAGVDVVIGGGLTAFAQYDGAVGGDIEKSGGVRLGARFEW